VKTLPLLQYWDPRYKLDVYDTTQDSVALKASAEVAIEAAYERYVIQHPATVIANNDHVAPSPPKKKKRRFPSNILTENELTIYLKECRIPEETSNPLEYWKLNKTRFPILAKMARDYLALQPTSKDVEGNFSKGRRTIPYYRRSQKASSIRNQMLVNSGFNLGVFE
jgi:hAT family C-terminal dimerisation region